MRLINTSTFTQVEFDGDDSIPPYAILSHTWGEHEVSFRDYQDQGYAQSLAGFQKIDNVCRLASARHLDWVWIDTCCIDKSSSAELSESINSMFTWYQKATVCFAYLVDLPSGLTASTDGDNHFERCRWFTRGFTLQELIAPRRVIFYGCNWDVYGEKDELAERISGITSIDVGTLRGKTSLDHLSIAKRMSWAARRRTKRIEDVAYCLIGIFGVNMPLLYGEGEKAFTRLQEEIMRDSDDQTLFAWRAHGATSTSTIHTSSFFSSSFSPSLQVLANGFPARGPLANSPDEFADSGDFVYLPIVAGDDPPYSMTNRGLHIKRPSIRNGDSEILFLSCCDSRYQPDYRILGIRIRRLPGGRGNVARVEPDKLFTRSLDDMGEAVETDVFIKKRFVGYDGFWFHGVHGEGKLCTNP